MRNQEERERDLLVSEGVLCRTCYDYIGDECGNERVCSCCEFCEKADDKERWDPPPSNNEEIIF